MSTDVPDDPPLSPPVDRDRSPPFHEMNAHPRRFERLTTEALELEPDLHRAALFGPSGESQFGIDVTADMRAGEGRDVASCKCQIRVQPHEWKEWSDAFLNHWESRWRTAGLRRFIVVVACENLDTVANRTARDDEAARFKAIGLAYEVWGPYELEQRLRRDRGLVVRRLGKPWADILCGPDPAESALVAAAARGQVVALHNAQLSIAELANAQIEAAREDIHCGALDAAATSLARVRDDPSIWLQLSTQRQAQVLRLQGSIALLRDDRDVARTLCDEALALDASARRLVAALCETPEESLTALGSPISLEDRQAEALYLLHARGPDAAHEALAALREESAEHPETLRILSFDSVLRNRRVEAFTLARAAEAKAPG